MKYDPPPIIYSEKPALLVIFLGKPKFEKIKDSELSFGVNTNWDVFQSESDKKYAEAQKIIEQIEVLKQK